MMPSVLLMWVVCYLMSLSTYSLLHEFQTLSRVPHLTVTWAHQTGPPTSEGNPFSRSPSLLHTSGPVPKGLQSASQSSPKQTTGHTHFDDSPSSRSIKDVIFPESQQSVISSDQSENDAVDGKPEDVFSSNAASSVVDDGELEDKRSPTKSNKVIFDPNSPSPLSVRYPLRSRSPNLTEHDFPPLGPMIGGHKMGGGCWGDQKQTKSSDGHEEYVLIFLLSVQILNLFHPDCPKSLQHRRFRHHAYRMRRCSL